MSSSLGLDIMIFKHGNSNIEFFFLFLKNSPRVIFLWDFMIKCDHEIENRKPEIVFMEKKSKLCWIIDTT